ELAQIGRAGVAIEQAQPLTPLAREIAGREVRRIPQLPDGTLHGVTRRIAHVLAAVYDARDRHRGDAGVTRNILDGRAGTKARAGPARRLGHWTSNARYECGG